MRQTFMLISQPKGMCFFKQFIKIFKPNAAQPKNNAGLLRKIFNVFMRKPPS
jgi:hypothetical protein